MNYHFPQIEFLSRRALAFSGIAACHVLIAYLLLTALIQAPPKPNDTPMQGFVLITPERQPPMKVEEFRRPDTHAKITVPAPDTLMPARQSSPMATVIDEHPTTESTVVPPVPVPVRVVGTNQLPNSEEFYPPDMRRQNIQGATNVRVCVDAQGARLGEPAIVESSGFPRLDEGAMNVAKHGRFAKSIQGDTPVGNCFRFRISFRITKQ